MDKNLPAKYENPVIIRQHNAITEARYEMTATEKNIICMILAQINNSDPIDKVYRIRVQDLDDLTNSQINYNHIRISTIKFIHRVYNIHTPDKIIQVSPLTVAKYEKRSGTIALKFSQEIRPYFFDLKNCFTEYDLHMILKLKSKNSKHLYEMLCQFKDTGIFKISIRQLKERLMLINLETDKEEYEKYGLFAKKVLDVAKKEIAKDTNLKFTYTTKKTGRKITHLEFNIFHLPIIKNITPSKADKVVELNTDVSKSESQSFKLKGEQLEQYLILTKELRWLHMHKNLAYTVVRSIPTHILWDHIYRIKLSVQKGEVNGNSDVINHFHGLLSKKKQIG
jgi:plasmid replication initiation protein